MRESSENVVEQSRNRDIHEQARQKDQKRDQRHEEVIGKAAGKGQGKKAKGDSKLRAAIKVQLIKFLLWACERKYSPDDHWTLKDAFEVSTMELRDQFIGAFSQSLKSANKPRVDEDDMDDMAAGRMRGRARRR